MKVSSPVVMKTNVTVTCYDVNTREKISENHYSNMAVDAGLDLLVSFLNGDAPTAITHFAVGTDDTATTAADTTLVAEEFRDVIAAKVKGDQTLTVQCVVSSAQANGETLQEVGLFNDDTAGDMYARVIIDPVTKTSLISMLVTWTLSFTSS